MSKLNRRARSAGAAAMLMAALTSWAALLPAKFAAAADQPTLPTKIQPAPAFTTQQLVAPPTSNWITNGGSLSNQRFSPLTAINRDTVRNLKGEWRTHLNGSGLGAQHSGQGQPIFYAGVLYVTTARTMCSRWTWPPARSCGPTNRSSIPPVSKCAAAG